MGHFGLNHLIREKLLRSINGTHVANPLNRLDLCLAKPDMFFVDVVDSRRWILRILIFSHMSIKSSNPLQSSSIRHSPPRFPAIVGKKSWKLGYRFCWVCLVDDLGEVIRRKI
ncbi:unnamed protein product [Arabis nemorensis]|uniref:Uncharacterized protein n=1 Tax=Arabis nemorensis TaxID=586526 RepID=A0A565AYY5_9BRAS|nr:unnamed protein product [Arabis nemorensis]